MAPNVKLERVERDSMGELRVPADALWGAQTQRAIENFPVSGQMLPIGFIHALARIKAAAACANQELGHLDHDRAHAIISAVEEILSGRHDQQFPIDVFQTGSGTSTNMNMNEVIAHLASSRLGQPVHPNDHVNMSQSSNDVIPSAIHLSALMAWREELDPALIHLVETIHQRAREFASVVKTGRTHLMDAMPLTLGQELSGWAAQIEHDRERLNDASRRLLRLALGGTAVGTGINAPEGFAEAAIRELARATQFPLVGAPNRFAAMASQDDAVEFSGALKTLAVSLMKIANDLRWMNSGPLTGLSEIVLKSLQPGSSIMPGKVNPVIPEATVMVAAQVIGNDVTITLAGQSGNFELNVMLPLVARNLLENLKLLARAARLLADRAIADFKVQTERLHQALGLNPILVTALNPVIGYERAAAIAKEAYQSGRPIFDVALEKSGLSEGELKNLLNPLDLTRGGDRSV
ncbi:MAG: class II fumarate hydratase [Gammaproteobacteria bacterium]